MHPLLRRQLAELNIHDVATPPSHETWHKLLAILDAQYARTDESLRYQALFDQGHHAVFVLTLEGKHISANAKAAQMLGYSLDELSQLSYQEIVAPDARHVSEDILQALLAGEPISPYPRLFQRRDGSQMPVEINVQLVRDDSGQPLHILSIVRDVTERRQIEAALHRSQTRFQRLIEDLQVGVIVYTPDGRISMVNEAALRNLGLTRDQAAGKTALDPQWNVIHEDGSDFPAEDQPVAVALSMGQPVANAVMGVYRPASDDRVWLLVNAQPQLDLKGVLEEVIVTFTDITEHKLSQRQHAELAAKTEAVETMRRLVSGISHDLRTPLSVINTGMYLLKRKIDDQEAVNRQIDTINGQVEHLKKIINDAMHLARMEDAANYEFELIDLNDILTTGAYLLEARYKQRTRPIERLLAPNLPRIEADRFMLSSAVHNLLINAITYTPPDGTIRLRTLSQSRGIVLEIEDAGIGVSPEHLPHIFEHFYRVDAARSTETGGTGLGLTIVMKVVRAHHGTIEVSSEVGQGTTFRIWLPLRRPPAS